MKAIAHAWLALMALERLKISKKSKTFKRSYLGKNFPGFYLGKNFDSYFQKQATNFTDFFNDHKDAFVKGAWFPDSVISDNLTGAHTFKLKKPSNQKEKQKAVQIKNYLPPHLHSLKALRIPESRLKEKICKMDKYTLPDRCEALSHALRDMVLIQKDEPKGSDILFNDDQITLYFLMLSHYIADAHVPPHCDDRDFYGPSKIHPDMESYWDKEIKKYYEFDKEHGVFDYNIGGAPELIQDPKKQEQFKNSILHKVIEELSNRTWTLEKGKEKKTLGKGNNKIYDYIKAICFASYLISTEFIPENTPPATFKKMKILKEKREELDQLSVHVLADAIDSIALIWILTFNKYKKLKESIQVKKKAIKKEGDIK